MAAAAPIPTSMSLSLACWENWLLEETMGGALSQDHEPGHLNYHQLLPCMRCSPQSAEKGWVVGVINIITSSWVRVLVMYSDSRTESKKHHELVYRVWVTGDDKWRGGGLLMNYKWHICDSLCVRQFWDSHHLLQCVAVCCGVLQCDAVWWGVFSVV